MPKTGEGACYSLLSSATNVCPPPCTTTPPSPCLSIKDCKSNGVIYASTTPIWYRGPLLLLLSGHLGQELVLAIGQGHELLVGPLLDHPAPHHHHDLVCLPNRRQPMRHHHLQPFGPIHSSSSNRMANNQGGGVVGRQEHTTHVCLSVCGMPLTVVLFLAATRRSSACCTTTSLSESRALVADQGPTMATRKADNRPHQPSPIDSRQLNCHLFPPDLMVGRTPAPPHPLTFIQQEDRRVFDDGTGDADPLFLTT